MMRGNVQALIWVDTGDRAGIRLTAARTLERRAGFNIAQIGHARDAVNQRDYWLGFAKIDQTVSTGALLSVCCSHVVLDFFFSAGQLVQ